MSASPQILRFAAYWWREILLGYRNLLNLEKGRAPEYPPADHARNKPAGHTAPPMADGATADSPTNATGRPYNTPRNGVLRPSKSDDYLAMPSPLHQPDAPAAAGLVASGMTAKPMPADNMLDLRRLLEEQRAWQNGMESDLDSDDAERQRRIQANLEAMAQREMAMQEYIQANADRARARKAEIEAEIRALAGKLNQREAERAHITAQNQAQAAQKSQEISDAIRAIFNEIDHLEDERKFIRRAISTPQSANDVLLQELIQRQRKLHQQTANVGRDERRAEQIRLARELRIKTRAERLAKLMSHRAEEIAAQKEALRQSKTQR